MTIKTPMFEAIQAARYHRQELFRTIKRLTTAPLIAYVCGSDALIERSDTVYFNDLLYRLKVNDSLDLLLHTPGGDIDAAEKLMSLLRLRVGVGRLRVIVPDFAKSAGTLMAIGADRVVMGDTSELGPIDPQVTITDGDGVRNTQSVQAYLDAYEKLTKQVNDDPHDAAAQILLSKFDPARIEHFKAVKTRARQFAENQLKRMCGGVGAYTRIAEQLSDTRQWPSHGQVINADTAQKLEINVDRLPADDSVWDACWRLYCLQRLAITRPTQKLFESEEASLLVDAATS